jgi:hypothetical protein
MTSKVETFGFQSLIQRYSRPILISTGIIVFWLCVFISGQPAPFIDDIFYTGAATNFAKHGVMYNPHLRLTWPFLTSFNIYPPTEQFALGYWLVFWGISTSSVLSFYMLCNTASSLAAMRLVRYFNLHPINVFISVLIIANTVLFLGFRVEAFSLACISIGLVFVITKSDRPLFALIGSFLSVLGCISAPSYLIPGILWFSVASYFALRRSANALRELTWFLLGSSAAGLAFLGSINFDVNEFLHNFLLHSKLAFHPPNVGMLLILLSIAVAACWSSARLRLTSIAVGITTISFVINSGPRGWEPLLLLCVTVVIAIETLLSESPFWAIVLRSVFLVSLSIIALPWIGYGLHYLLDRPSQARLVSLKKSKVVVTRYESLGKSIALDPFVARTYYDFRIPDRAVAWGFSLSIVDAKGYRLREDLSEEGINGIWFVDSWVLENYYSDVDRLGLGDIRQAATSSRKEISTGFAWWRVRVFELLPRRFMNMIFLGQNFIRYFPLGGIEDPVIIDIESRKLYRGDQLIFESLRARN